MSTCQIHYDVTTLFTHATTPFIHATKPFYPCYYNVNNLATMTPLTPLL